MTTATRILPSVLALALTLTFSAGHASAQAMIGYGHAVAKSAGAGAAVGAGVGGTLTGLGNPLAKAADGAPGPNRTGPQRQTVPARRGEVHWDVPSQGFGAPAPMGLVGGVKATGVTKANWQPTLLAPSQNLAVISAVWGGATESSAESDQPAAEEAAPAAQTPAAAKGKSPIVMRSTGRAASVSGQSTASASPSVAPAAIPEGVAVGTPVEQVIQKLGRPHLALRGVAGEGYTDQYVFELPDGAHLIVYVLDGVVSHVVIG